MLTFKLLFLAACGWHLGTYIMMLVINLTVESIHRLFK